MLPALKKKALLNYLKHEYRLCELDPEMGRRQNLVY